MKFGSYLVRLMKPMMTTRQIKRHHRLIESPNNEIDNMCNFINQRKFINQINEKAL